MLQENLIRQKGKGFYQLMHFFDMTRIMVASQGVGLAQGALERYDLAALHFLYNEHSGMALLPSYPSGICPGGGQVVTL